VEATRLEIEGTEHLALEKNSLEARLDALKTAAAGLMDSSETNGETRRINDEFIDTQRRLQDVCDELQSIQSASVNERDVSEYLRRLDPIWEELYPLEQCRIIKLLVEQIVVRPEGMDIRIRTNGVHSLISELRGAVSEHEER